jgi:hypothetical protein
MNQTQVDEEGWETAPNDGWESARVRQPSIYAPREQWAEYRAAQQRGEAIPGPTTQKERTFAAGSTPGEIVFGLLEAPLTMVSGAAGAVAGGLAGLGRGAYELAMGRGGDVALQRAAKQVEDVQGAMTYQPRTAVGAAIPQILSAPMTAAQTVGRAAGEAVGGPAGGELGTAVPDIAATVVGGASALRGRAPTGAPQFSQEQQAIKNAQAAGFRGLPSEIRGGPVNVGMESVAKQAPLVKRLAAFNEERASQLARQDIGLPPTGRLDEQSLKQVRDRAGAVYDQVRSLPETIDVRRVNPNWVNDVVDLDAKFRSIKNVLPDIYRNPSLERLRGSMARVRTLTPEETVDIIRTLRDESSRTLKRTDVSSKEVDAAYAIKEAANMFENLLDTHLQATGRGALMNRYRAARETLAKTYTIEDATNLTTGKVDPQAIRRARDKGEKLSGNLLKIADAAAALPSVVRKTEGMITPEGMVLSDYAMGLGIPAAIFSNQPAVAAGLAAGAAARPAVRAAAGSEWYQRQFAQPRAETPRPPLRRSAPGAAAIGVAAQPNQAPFLMSEEEQQ